MVDGEGYLHRFMRHAGYPLGNPTRPMPPQHRRRLDASRDLTRFAGSYARERGVEPLFVLGLRDPLVNVNTLAVSIEIDAHADRSAVMLGPGADLCAVRGRSRRSVRGRERSGAGTDGRRGWAAIATSAISRRRRRPRDSAVCIPASSRTDGGSTLVAIAQGEWFQGARPVARVSARVCRAPDRAARRRPSVGRPSPP